MVLSIGSFYYVKVLLTAENATENAVTAGAMTYLMYINGCIAGFAFLTLLLRYTKPRLGNVFTKALNILLLFCFPVGTALGIYGLIKVDCRPKQ
jgi:hypothetical protein